MATDGAQGNGGDDPVDDLFDAIQTVHDRRVKEETQTALLRNPPQESKPSIRTPWLISAAAAIVLLMTLAGWLFSRFKETTEPQEVRARGNPEAPSGTAEPWAERSQPIPAYQPPAPPSPTVASPAPPPAPPPAATSPTGGDTLKSYQEEVQPVEARTRPAFDPEDVDPEEEAPKPSRASPPLDDSQSESFFE